MIVQGDALRLPLADESVDLIVTSPPYFALRSYRDDGKHYDGQIGSEPTPAAFLDALWAATAEMVRVLKPSGSLWIKKPVSAAKTAFGATVVTMAIKPTTRLLDKIIIFERRGGRAFSAPALIPVRTHRHSFDEPAM